MFKTKFLLIIIIAVFSFGFCVPVLQAVDLNQQVSSQLQAGAEKAGMGEARDPRQAVATLIQMFLGLMGAIFLVMIAIASFWYITARGQEQKIEKATSTIRGATIGLIIVIMAYSITYFVSKRVQKAAGIVPTSSIIELLTPRV